MLTVCKCPLQIIPIDVSCITVYHGRTPASIGVKKKKKKKYLKNRPLCVSIPVTPAMHIVGKGRRVMDDTVRNDAIYPMENIYRENTEEPENPEDERSSENRTVIPATTREHRESNSDRDL